MFTRIGGDRCLLFVMLLFSFHLVYLFFFFRKPHQHACNNRMLQPVYILLACTYIMREGWGSGLACPGPGSCCRLWLTQAWPQLQPCCLTALPVPGPHAVGAGLGPTAQPSLSPFPSPWRCPMARAVAASGVLQLLPGAVG